MKVTMDTCTLAEKFTLLFEAFPAPDGRVWTLTDLSQQTGVAINSLSRLKTGRIEDPRLSTLRAIAAFYRISLDYFACTTQQECRHFLQQELQRRRTVPQIATRVRSFSQDVIDDLQKMMAYIEQLEDEALPLLADKTP